MIYVISITESSNKDENALYKFLETHTESTFRGDAKFLKQLIIKHKLSIKNASLIANKIIIKQWPNKLRSQVRGAWGEYDRHILLCKIDDDTFKIINKQEIINYVTSRELREYIDDSTVCNCTVLDGEYKSTDTYEVIKNREFESLIAKKYDRHYALASLLGYDMKFDYVIEGEEVKIKRYTGASRTVILPSFITSLLENSFTNHKIDKLTLNNGLRYIGTYAFTNCDIPEVVIPETVRIVFKSAFILNNKLVNNGGSFRDTLKILSNKTTII